MTGNKKGTMETLDLYLSPDGDDQCTGMVQPNGPVGGGAVRTLARARELVRTARARGFQATINIHLRGGRYPLLHTWEFDPRDGGNSAGPTVWRSCRGEQATISGGVALQFREGTFNGAACWSADVPAALNPLQLFVNGWRATRPRLPRAGYFRFASTFGQSKPPGSEWGTGPTEAEYAAGDLRPFRNLEDVRLTAMGPWFEMPMRITAIDEARRAVKFHRPTWDQLIDETRQFARYFVENVAEAFGEPGDWYFDRPSGKMYYLPRPGESIDSVMAYVPAVQTLLRVRGTADQPVRNLRFENLAFEHCNWHAPEAYRGSIQAEHLVPGAIKFEHAESCVLFGCKISRVHQFGVEMGVGSHDCRVIACSLSDLGAGGVRVNHEWLQAHSHEVDGDPAGERGKERPRAATIADCHIHHGGRIHLSAVGIYVGNASRCRIIHNEITELRYSGVSVGWMWGNGATAAADNQIDFNHIHHINMEKVFSDLGLIYTLGTQPGTTIRNNHLHHVDSYGYGGNAIYTDEGSSQILIENNVATHCRATSFGGGQRDVVVRNNVFGWGREQQVTPTIGGTEYFATVFERNIITWREGTCGNPAPWGWDPLTVAARDNIFWAIDRPLELTDGQTIEYWQGQGTLHNTLVADPLFVDPEACDFRIRQDSPVQAHGFKPIDTSTAGPRGTATQYLSYAEWSAAHPDPQPRPSVLARVDQVDEQTLSVRLENCSAFAVRGTYRWHLPAGSTLDDPHDIVADLAPGQQLNLCRTLTGPDGSWRVGLTPVEAELTPAFCIAQCGVPSVNIASVQAASGVAEVGDRLAQVPEFILRHEGRGLASVRVAFAGDQLLVAGRVIDAQVRRGPDLARWEGSTLELFLAPNFRGVPQQIVLAPDRACSDVKVHRQERLFVPVPQPEIPVRLNVVDDGYVVYTMIPLERFGLENSTRVYRFELTANLFLTADAKEPIKVKLVNAEQPWRVTRGMARGERQV